MKRIDLVILITVLFSFLFMPYGQSSQPPPSELSDLSHKEQNRTTLRYELTEIKKSDANRPASSIPQQISRYTHTEEADKTKDVGQVSSLNWSNLFLVIFTGLLAIFNCLLWWSTHKMWRATRDNADLTYKAFIAANRPRLRIRRVHSDPEVVPVWIYISNVGGSDATGIVLHAVFTLKTGNRRQAPWIENLSKSVWNGPTKLAPGEEGTYELRSEPDVAVNGYETSFDVAADEKILSIIGKVRYSDANKTERETGFEWTYDPDTGEFSRQEKVVQYTYED